MRFHGIERTFAKIAGETDAVDDVPQVAAGQPLMARGRLVLDSVFLQIANEMRADEA